MSEDRMKNPEAEAEAAAEGKTEETAATNPSPAPVSEPAADENGADSTTDTPAEAPAETTEETTPDETVVLRDRLLRLQADFDNYRKRMARDRQDFVTQANADVLEAMLPPMDHLELAIDTMAKTAAEDDPFLKGVRMVRDEILSAFSRFSLEPIETKVGAELDPQCEEALGLLPTPGIEENHIALVVRKGYRLHGKVLRAAQVMAGAGTPAAEPADPKKEV